MLRVSEDDRISIAEMRFHPWVLFLRQESFPSLRNVVPFLLDYGGI